MKINTKVMVPVAVVGAAALLFIVANKGHGASANTLEVYVFDENGAPLNLSKRATVELLPPSIIKTTGITGMVQFQWLEQNFELPAPYTINVNLEGYDPYSYTGTLNPGDNKVDVQLQLSVF
jgi:hypothetical protein